MEKPLTYPLEKVSEPVRFSMLFETKTRKIQSGPKKPAGVLTTDPPSLGKEASADRWESMARMVRMVEARGSERQPSSLPAGNCGK